MTAAQMQIHKRIEELERGLAELRTRVEKTAPASQRRWWVDDAGRFADDPVFDRIAELGRRYRTSERKQPGAKRDRS